MESILKSFFEPGTWIGALVIAIAAIFIAPLLPRTLKATVLWVPKRIGRFFVAFYQHFKTMNKGKADPIAAVSYVGRQLGLLIMYASICIISIGAIATLQIIDIQWALAWHKWVVIAATLCTVVSLFRGGSIVFLLVFFCEMITNPLPTERTKPVLKLGSFELFPPKPTPSSSGQEPPPQTPPPTYEQNGTAGDSTTEQSKDA